MKDKMKRVEGSDSLYRTPEGAIVNTNKEGYEAYKRKRAASIKKEEDMRSLEDQLSEAKQQIEELKELIKKHIQ